MNMRFLSIVALICSRKETRAVLMHPVSKGDSAPLLKIRDWLSSLLAFNVPGKEAQGTRQLCKSFYILLHSRNICFFCYFHSYVMHLKECLVLSWHWEPIDKMVWRKLALWTAAGRGELSTWDVWESGEDGELTSVSFYQVAGSMKSCIPWLSWGIMTTRLYFRVSRHFLLFRIAKKNI